MGAVAPTLQKAYRDTFRLLLVFVVSTASEY